jgi:ABC-2 type transport system ATP-binding protein
MQALQLLNDARIELMDIALRRPSLDEVFLALTGDDTGGRRKDADKRVAADAYA